MPLENTEAPEQPQDPPEGFVDNNGHRIEDIVKERDRIQQALNDYDPDHPKIDILEEQGMLSEANALITSYQSRWPDAHNSGAPGNVPAADDESELSAADTDISARNGRPEQMEAESRRRIATKPQDGRIPKQQRPDDGHKKRRAQLKAQLESRLLTRQQPQQEVVPAQEASEENTNAYLPDAPVPDPSIPIQQQYQGNDSTQGAPSGSYDPAPAPIDDEDMIDEFSESDLNFGPGADADAIEYDKTGELLLTRERYQGILHGTNDFTVVAWRKMGYGKQVVVQYGPKRDARYRLMSSTAADCLWNPGDAGVSDILGESRGHDPEWTKQDVMGIGQVAWKFDDGEDPLLGIDPARAKERKEKKKRYPQTIAVLKWSDGVRTWESRDTVRKYFSANPKDGDGVMFRQASYQEKKYKDYLEGKGERDKAAASTVNQREPANAPVASTKPYARRPQVQRSRPDDGFQAASGSALHEFRRQWLEMSELDEDTPFNRLSPEQKTDIMAAWQVERGRRLNEEEPIDDIQ